jgi:hypothetical protein
MQGGSMTRGDPKGSRGRQDVTVPEKKMGATKDNGVTRGGQVEMLPDRRRWRDKKLKRQRTRGNTTTSRGRQEA